MRIIFNGLNTKTLLLESKAHAVQACGFTEVQHHHPYLLSDLTPCAFEFFDIMKQLEKLSILM